MTGNYLENKHADRIIYELLRLTKKLMINATKKKNEKEERKRRIEILITVTYVCAARFIFLADFNKQLVYLNSVAVSVLFLIFTVHL